MFFLKISAETIKVWLTFCQNHAIFNKEVPNMASKQYQTVRGGYSPTKSRSAGEGP